MTESKGVKRTRRIIKRRPGKTPKANMYFNMETQAAIIEYQNSEEGAEIRPKLYVEKILPAFNKLAENLIFIYGFSSPSEPYETLKSDCVTFLYESIHKWSPDRGTRAFSYFNVVAKNWLIINSRQKKKRNQRHVSIEDPKSMSQTDRHSLARYDIVPPPDEILIKRNFRNEIMDVLLEIKKRIKNENERLCINAITVVFEMIDELDFLNKRAVFVYVRDISGLSPKKLSVAMSSIRKHYRSLVKPGSDFNIF